MNPFRTFGLAGQLLLAALILIVLAVLVRCAAAPDRARARADRAAAVLAGGQAASTAQAMDIVAAAARRDAAADKLTQENADAIRTAPGAGQVLDPRLNRAGLDGLCMRDAYRHSARCMLAPGPSRSP